MARGPVNFKQSDMTRALRATMAAGVEVERVEVEQGKIKIIIVKPDTTPEADDDGDEWK